MNEMEEDERKEGKGQVCGEIRRMDRDKSRQAGKEYRLAGYTDRKEIMIRAPIRRPILSFSATSTYFYFSPINDQKLFQKNISFPHEMVYSLE